MSLNEPQGLPQAGVGPKTWQLVIADMNERDEWGARKYGTRHQYDNGRDHLVDAYQEALDLAVYLRAEIEKRRADPSYSELKALRQEVLTIRKAFGQFFETAPLAKLVERIEWLRSLVRK